MILPADRQFEEDTVLARVRAGEGMTHYETIRVRKDGTPIPISPTVSPIYDDAGRVIGASKIARDISDWQRADLATARLVAVIESSDDAIITKNPDSTITSWNPAAERMFGYTEAEAIGRSVRMLIPQELQGEEDSVLARIRAGEIVDHYETIRRRKDGTHLSISLTVSISACPGWMAASSSDGSAHRPTPGSGSAGGGSDGVRAIGRSHQGAAQRF